MKKSSTQSLVSLPIATDDGVFMAHYSEKGLLELNFPGAQVSAAPKRIESGSISSAIRVWHKLTAAALKKALSGHNPRKLPPLDWTGTTPFQQSVWRAMLKIDCGATQSYGQIARAIHKPLAVRAVGGACGANPIPVLVPCHRVLAAHGLGGFGGGLDWKRRLLAHEGIVL